MPIQRVTGDAAEQNRRQAKVYRKIAYKRGWYRVKQKVQRRDKQAKNKVVVRKLVLASLHLLAAILLLFFGDRESPLHRAMGRAVSDLGLIISFCDCIVKEVETRRETVFKYRF